MATTTDRTAQVLAELQEPGHTKEERDELHAQLLELRIEESGLSARRFALEVLLRDDRTIRRWIARDVGVPQIVAEWLERPEPMPWPRRS